MRLIEMSFMASEERIQKERQRADTLRIADSNRVQVAVAANCDIQALIEFLDEIGSPDKSAFLEKASALLFPVNWPDPLALEMIESRPCGTPVIAYPNGSGPEIVDQGISGCGT
jgi:glycosyltransferase involved in cell wall biosynthesis